ncbi:hypothetical protein CCHR01_13861 [Colletotrichum chrysophilum]|uniref:Uncharacterized protein n=1 Tax=Colletotrichum chrysophilum TaxID=1836956 RepID=A0AAD9A9Q3_9PEZI|nr:hypothetical protein CCHR01_13861 [Colletotrichum chrysophilum]
MHAVAHAIARANQLSLLYLSSAVWHDLSCQPDQTTRTTTCRCSSSRTPKISDHNFLQQKQAQRQAHINFSVQGRFSKTTIMLTPLPAVLSSSVFGTCQGRFRDSVCQPHRARPQTRLLWGDRKSISRAPKNRLLTQHCQNAEGHSRWQRKPPRPRTWLPPPSAISSWGAPAAPINGSRLLETWVHTLDSNAMGHVVV